MKAVENRERGGAGQHQGAGMKTGWQTKKLGDVCAFDKTQGIHRGLPCVGLGHNMDLHTNHGRWSKAHIQLSMGVRSAL